MDTTVLVYLHRIHQLDLLPRLFDEVLISQTVLEELTAGRQRGHDVPDAGDLSRAGVRVSPPGRTAPVPKLGEGETATISLAQAAGAIAVLDDRAARSYAASIGLSFAGTAGLLLRAKRQGLVTDFSTLLESLRNAGLWLDDETIQVLLDASAG